MSGLWPFKSTATLNTGSVPDPRIQSVREFLGDQVVPARLVWPGRSHQQADVSGKHPP